MIKIFGVISGIAMLMAAAWVISIWPPRCPVELRVVRLEPSSMIYYAGSNGVEITLTLENRDRVDVMYDNITTSAAKVGGRWIAWEMPQFIGGARMSAGGQMEGKIVIPVGTEACRVRVRYASETWRSRFMVSIGPAGRRWLAKSVWLRKFFWPEAFNTIPAPPSWKSTTVEIKMP
jgi:hypothetical protein